ncbi:hypothetical protein HanIR_Chr12g0611201 [Helianthus annuus]|nr:hypothetical protein HanIR_Chr12g0611201 [Helianthus annuus]
MVLKYSPMQFDSKVKASPGTSSCLVLPGFEKGHCGESGMEILVPCTSTEINNPNYT